MLGRTAFDPRLILDIGREIARTRARILHVHGYAASNFGRIAARRAGIPLVLHEHFADPKMPGYQKIPDLFLRDFIAAGIAVSKALPLLQMQQERGAGQAMSVWTSCGAQALKESSRAGFSAGISEAMKAAEARRHVHILRKGD
jgi:hypothetical protein